MKPTLFSLSLLTLWSFLASAAEIPAGMHSLWLMPSEKGLEPLHLPIESIEPTNDPTTLILKIRQDATSKANEVPRVIQLTFFHAAELSEALDQFKMSPVRLSLRFHLTDLLQKSERSARLYAWDTQLTTLHGSVKRLIASLD